MLGQIVKKDILHSRVIFNKLTLRTMAPPVEWAKQKHGKPGFPAMILSRKAICAYSITDQKNSSTGSTIFLFFRNITQVIIPDH